MASVKLSLAIAVVLLLKLSQGAPTVDCVECGACEACNECDCACTICDFDLEGDCVACEEDGCDDDNTGGEVVTEFCSCEIMSFCKMLPFIGPNCKCTILEDSSEHHTNSDGSCESSNTKCCVFTTDTTESVVTVETTTLTQTTVNGVCMDRGDNTMTCDDWAFCKCFMENGMDMCDPEYFCDADLCDMDESCDFIVCEPPCGQCGAPVCQSCAPVYQYCAPVCECGCDC